MPQNSFSTLTAQPNDLARLFRSFKLWNTAFQTEGLLVPSPKSLNLRDIWDQYHDVKCKLRINYAITSHHATINADLIHERSLLVMNFKSLSLRPILQFIHSWLNSLHTSRNITGYPVYLGLYLLLYHNGSKCITPHTCNINKSGQIIAS